MSAVEHPLAAQAVSELSRELEGELNGWHDTFVSAVMVKGNELVVSVEDSHGDKQLLKLTVSVETIA